jgi:Putative auto-transporter adhesin, head GIN domain
MKKSIVGLFLIVTIPLWAQQTETRSLSSFKGIKVSQAIDAYLKKGEKESVRIEVTGGSPSDVITEVEGSSLKIRMRDSHNFWSKTNVKVYVTYVTLEKISASSASSVFSDGVIKTGNIDIAVSSAANVEVSLDASSVMVDTSSAGEVVLEGKSPKLEIEVSSAGDVDAYKLECETVVASVSSGGEAKISVSKDLEAHASSGGDIRYRGNPSRTNTNSSSGGSVKKSN